MVEVLGRTHILSGEVAWLAIAPQFTHNGWHIALGIPIAAIGALGPDIDHGNSTISHSMFWLPDGLNRLGHMLFRVRRQRMGDVIGRALGGHRYGAHSLLSIPVVFGVTSLSVLWPPLGGWWLPLAFTLGWVAHIAGDCLTEHGVGLAWPYTRRRFRLLSINTGGGVELLVRLLLHVTRIALILLVSGISLQPFLQ